MKSILINIVIMAFFSLQSLAQNNDEQTLTVSLTDPGKPGKLKLHQVSGSISVMGYNGNSVVVKAATRQGNNGEVKQKNGMFQIPNNAYNLSVVEKDNEVNISSGSPNKAIDYNIMVPNRFSLNLHTVNNGEIYVENIEGDIEANNVNGSIELKDISGSAIASTINGKVLVSFSKIDEDVPMAFSSLNGKIDVTFPANLKATAKIRNERGEIYSDFEMDIQKSEPVVEKDEGKNYRKYSIDKWIYGNINGGGPEFLFKNMNGNIYIRKK